MIVLSAGSATSMSTLTDIITVPSANRVTLTLVVRDDNSVRTYSVNVRASEVDEARIKLLERPEAWLVKTVSA